MPIIYDKKQSGFRLKNPTTEEQEALERIAITFITETLGRVVAEQFIAAITVRGSDTVKH
jgi:hypothetical protein